VIERTITAATHGRYLVEPPAAGATPVGTLFGFHGYAEGAEAQLERMRGIPGADEWLLVSVQGLHRFYHRRANEVVASWMTRQDRELAIADNVAYVLDVLEAVARDWASAGPLVFAGFSQGVATSLRAAAAAPHAVGGVIAVGGDVPPEIDRQSLGRVSRVLVCRGARDEWYTTAKFDADIGRLRAAGAMVTPLAFDGGHEWSDSVHRAAGAFLHAMLQPR
jgi:predicted esterase